MSSEDLKESNDAADTGGRIAVTPEVVRSHGLTAEEYRSICEWLGREPNYTELGIFSVMWSEHCSYKSSKIHLKLLPTEGPQVLQGPGENAGVVDIGEGRAVVFKMESHNHPSYIEPYQGAATGVGGILRDVFTMGARPVATLNSLRFGSIDHPRTSYLLDGVVRGIGGYGNCIGVPTVGGEVYFDASYNANILVNAFTLGIVDTGGIFKGTTSGFGNTLMYVGSKTGRDGIHGATMASEAFSQEAEQRRPTVQVGDPFTEKLLLEACLEIMKKDCVLGIQDMGAAGLTSSSAEMAARGGTGVEIELGKVPLREQGMTPYEILLSESQERMLLVVKAGREEEVRQTFERWDLDAVAVGRVIEDPVFRALEQGREVACIPVASLTEGAPVYDRPAKRPQGQDRLQELDLRSIPQPGDLSQVLLRLAADPNVASKEWVYQQYDHLVRTNTVVGPGADASVLRVKGTRKGLALTVDGNGRYCFLDPYIGGMITVAEAARNLASVGARPIGLSDCLNFGSPEQPEVMWQFSQALLGIRESCLALNVPVVSGNVSFYNETDGIPIYPTPIIAMVGLLGDAERHVTPWFKSEGDLIVLLGRNGEELGGSEYLRLIHGRVCGKPPALDLEVERAVQATCRRAIEAGLLHSAHDLSEGGLGVALAEACVGGPEIGAHVELRDAGRPDALLFGETQSRILVSLAARDSFRLQEIAREEGAPLDEIGVVAGRDLVVRNLIHISVEQMRTAWRTGLERLVS